MDSELAGSGMKNGNEITTIKKNFNGDQSYIIPHSDSSYMSDLSSTGLL